MLVENLGGKGDRFLCGDSAVSLYLNGKLVVVCDVTYTGVLYVVFNLVYRGENRVNEDKTDRSADVGADFCKVVPPNSEFRILNPR